MKILFLLLVTLPLWAANTVYIAASAAGADNGTSCANAKAVSYFNSSGNWSATPTGIQIGPGTTVRACGTFTGSAGGTVLTTQGSGTSGNPVTVLAETGAIFTATYWSVNGALRCNGHSFITFDGGTNGLVQATANGDSLANQQGSTSGISSPADGGCNNFIVKNWTISNIYVKVEMSATAVDDSTGIVLMGDNIRAHDNTIDHIATGIAAGYCGFDNIEVDHNTITYSNHHIASGASGVACSMDNFLIHDNDVGPGTYIYDNLANNYHHNGIHLFADSSNGPNPTITNMKIYNNYIHGVFTRDTAYGASHTTAWIFINDGGGTGTIPNIQIFNNLIVQEAGDLYGPSNGYIAGANSGALIYNNTIVGDNNQSAGCINVADFSTTRIKNNIMQKCGYAVRIYSGYGSGAQVDYNTYYDLYSGGQWSLPSGGLDNYATWQAGGYDANGQNGNNPLLTGTFHLGSGSPAISDATNLTAAGITALNSDKDGVGRPSGATAWDSGAYQFGADVTAPTVTSITSSTGNGTYTTGQAISIQIVFSEAVTVTGTPQLALNSGATVNYSSGSTTATLTFTYTIGGGETAADLDYTSTSALTLNSGTIADGSANNATLTLFAPGAAGSLGANKALVVNPAAVSSGHRTQGKATAAGKSKVN